MEADPSEDVALANYLVAYIDRLGTKAFVSTLDLKQAEADATKLSAAIRQLEATSGAEKVVAFTDNVVLLTPSTRESGMLQAVLSGLATYQCFLACNGWLMRGALVEGPAYHSEIMVTGAGLVDAVVAEEKLASTSRIFVSHELVKALVVDPGLAQYVCLDNRDECHFVDYSVALQELSRPDRHEAWSQHRESVIQGLADAELKSNELIRRKQLWLAQYHDFSAERFGFNDLLIERGSVPASTTFGGAVQEHLRD